MGTFNFIVLGLLFLCLCYMGEKIRVVLGNMPDRSFESYSRVGGPNLGFVTSLLFTVSYPFWRFMYVMNGEPYALPEPETLSDPLPEPPAPPDPSEWIAETCTRFRAELHKEFPDLSEPTQDGIVEAVSEILTVQYVAHYQAKEAFQKLMQGDEGAREAPLRKLVQAFIQLLNRVPLLTKHQARIVMALPDAVSKDAVDEFFRILDFSNVSERYWHWSDFGLGLTGGAPKLMEKLHIDPIGERNSPAHIRYNLRETPKMASIVFPVGLPLEARFQGTWIVAPQGSGKTTLLSDLLMYDLGIHLLKNECSIIVLDSKGDLIHDLARNKAFGPGLPLTGKLTLIEPSGDLAINPLDLGVTTGHSIELLEYVLTGLLDTDPTPLQLLVLRKLILACRAIPGATLMTMREILMHGWKRYETQIAGADQLTAEYFVTGQFEESEAKVTKKALLWRIEDLITRVDLLKGMFRSPSTKVDMTKLMDTPSLIIIDNSVAKLTQTGSELFGRFFIALILAAAQQRAGRSAADKLPVFVYLDEAQTVIHNDPKIATILQTCRSQKIAMTFAHQQIQQIDSPDVRQALKDCAIRFANPDADAAALEEPLRMSAERLQSLPKGKFALFVRDHTSRGVEVVIANEPVSKWDKMKDEQFEAIRADMRARYTFTPPPKPTPPPAANPDDVDTAPKEWGG